MVVSSRATVARATLRATARDTTREGRENEIL